MKLNTPTAIFLGLALIASAIFFRQPSISEAQATGHNTVKKIAICNKEGTRCASIDSRGRLALGD